MAHVDAGSCYRNLAAEGDRVHMPAGAPAGHKVPWLQCGAWPSPVRMQLLYKPIYQPGSPTKLVERMQGDCFITKPTRACRFTTPSPCSTMGSATKAGSSLQEGTSDVETARRPGLRWKLRALGESLNQLACGLDTRHLWVHP